ncbi:MAG: hypothetical protein WB445_12185 [Acinetobacter sp.]
MTAAAEQADRQREAPEMIGNLPQLPARWALIAVPLILSRLMSSIISFVKMLCTLGRFDGFIVLRLHKGVISRAIPCLLRSRCCCLCAGFPACRRMALPYFGNLSS